MRLEVSFLNCIFAKKLEEYRIPFQNMCQAMIIIGSNVGVASFARAKGRAAPTRRPPTVLNADAGVVKDRLLVVNFVMLAVI